MVRLTLIECELSCISLNAAFVFDREIAEDGEKQ